METDSTAGLTNFILKGNKFRTLLNLCEMDNVLVAIDILEQKMLS